MGGADVADSPAFAVRISSTYAGRCNDNNKGDAAAGPRRFRMCTLTKPPGAGSIESGKGAAEASLAAPGVRTAKTSASVAAARPCSRRMFSGSRQDTANPLS